jgi:hypothetical protein
VDRVFDKFSCFVFLPRGIADGHGERQGGFAIRKMQATRRRANLHFRGPTLHCRKEFAMKQFLSSLFAILAGSRQVPRAARPRSRVRLHLETMEGRLVPAVITNPAPALVTSPVLTSDHTLTARNPGGPVQPDTPVHGYKWRRPRPYETGPAETKMDHLIVIVVD